ncbi:GspH/FimT family pseudopilin [Rhodoblastus acidophilus]|uniref:GspH/FimT family pseudopilin n=1 Tax=Rhodoblastus acidophilus TaxID=1074 RepID=UPI000B4FEDA0|nr:GspH/FimT family pseudopilin [Rhodoblastus acidophilus]MCW2318877.1 general secretion pathway protein H [Rhodoblastus acidophilus]PPQ35759.1 type II secretion system protein GspH [Rhodoblastus acidophilus]RAI20001.1 type II secretion system protein GspH [Rhodoblastus acidophilus]
MRISRAKNLRAGFTLLEMLAALALVALVGSIAAQLLQPKSPRLRLEVAVRGLCGTLRAAQARAAANHEPTLVVIDVGAKTYFSSVNGQGRLPSDATITLTLARNETASGQGGIRFFPDGGASGGDIVLGLEGRSARISVNWLTGGAICVSD